MRLPGPEFPELGHERVRQEQVALSATLGDLVAGPGPALVFGFVITAYFCTRHATERRILCKR